MSSDTQAVPDGQPELPPRNRHLALALAELAESQRDLALSALTPPAEQNRIRLGAALVNLDRAAARIRTDMLGQQAPPPVAAPAVTDAMQDAAMAALELQYRAEPWEEAKDVLEGIDFAPIIAAALAAQTPKETSA